jgi:hypothetical protein
VVHWDGKIMKDTTGGLNEKFNRITVVVTGLNTEKILGIPKASSGSGETQTVNTYNLLKRWNVDNEVVGRPFNTIHHQTPTSIKELAFYYKNF